MAFRELLGLAERCPLSQPPHVIRDLADELLHERYIANATADEYLLISDLINAMLDLADQVRQVQTAEMVEPTLASLSVREIRDFAATSVPAYSISALLAARHFSPAQRGAIIELAHLVEKLSPELDAVADPKTLIQLDVWCSLRTAAKQCLSHWA